MLLCARLLFLLAGLFQAAALRFDRGDGKYFALAEEVLLYQKVVARH
jgi:hypothetical protein